MLSDDLFLDKFFHIFCNTINSYVKNSLLICLRKMLYDIDILSLTTKHFLFNEIDICKVVIYELEELNS